MKSFQCQTLVHQLSIPSSNSIVERAMATVKHLWKNASDKKNSKGTALDVSDNSPWHQNPFAIQTTLWQKASIIPTFYQSLDPQYSKTDLHHKTNLNVNRSEQSSRIETPIKMPSLFNLVTRSMRTTPSNMQWEPATFVNRERDFSYIVKRGPYEIRRTREYLKPRRVNLMPERVITPQTQPVMVPEVRRQLVSYYSLWTISQASN